ncbi:MAG: pseudouridine synthase [Anaerolineales bacterium]
MQLYRYLIFHKPYGVLSTFTDAAGRLTLKDYINVPGVYAAGRLDMASEGLLLLTDDGKLIQHLTDPRWHLPKTYLVQVEGVPAAEQLASLERGVLLYGVKTRRCQVMVIPEPNLPPRQGKPITPHGRTSWLRMVIFEGKKHQVRHMTAAVGLPTLRLVRIAIGELTLGVLKPGEWRFLREDEIIRLKQKHREYRS